MMKSLPTSSKLILLLTCMALTATAAAQSSAAFEQHVVHYNAMNASLLPPEVAQQYNIQRSTSRGLINITVLEKVLALPNKPVHAVVKVTARNLTGQLRTLTMQEVEEQGAIYYLGQLRVRDQETFDFHVEVTPDGCDKPLIVDFRQQFFTGTE
ncbi:MAG: DUF4426 domain-containing protein [Gammaproteobacteria bacterium]|jgi:hypothetical protein|nr:DUF4426 domain-containing protein [Gammaproteobacteria bacterium]